MTNDLNLSTWTTYQAAWADTTPAERMRLLDASVADACVYVDPLGTWVGKAEITRLIDRFRADMPGVFFRNHAYLHHHGWSAAQWTLYDTAGAELQPGVSIAEYGAGGHIVRVTGFFPFPPVEGGR